MFPSRWNTYYFNSLVVSIVHSHKKLRVGLTKFSFANKWNFTLLTNAWTDECPIVCSQDYPITRFLYIPSFSIKVLIHLGLASSSLSNMSDSVSLTETIHVISNWSCHRRQNNEHPFLKASPAELAVASWLLLHSVHVSQPIARKRVLFWGELMHAPSSATPFCTIICGTIHHLI